MYYIPFIQVTAGPLLILSIHYSSRITMGIFRDRIRGGGKERPDSDSNAHRSRCRSTAIPWPIVFIGRMHVRASPRTACTHCFPRIEIPWLIFRGKYSVHSSLLLPRFLSFRPATESTGSPTDFPGKRYRFSRPWILGNGIRYGIGSSNTAHA